MPTVTALKKLLQDQVAPDDDTTFIQLLSEADMRLLAWGRWGWTRGRLTLTPVDGIITLPTGWASIIGAQVDGVAHDIKDENFEFVPDGVGEVEVGGGGNNRLIDQGVDDDGIRTYKVAGRLADGAQILAICHKAPAILFDPDMDDSDLPAEATDIPRCPDVAALKQAMLGIISENANDPTQSSKYFAIALRGLDDREKSQRGGARAQVPIRPNGAGMHRIRHMR